MKRFHGAALCLLLLLASTVGTSRGSVPCKEGCSLAPGHEGECILYDAGWQNEANGAWAYGSLAAALHFVADGGTVKLLRDFYVSPQTGVPMISKSITLTSADPSSPCRLTTAMSPHPTLLGVMADVHLRDVIIDGGAELAANGPLVLVQQGSLTLDEGAVIRNNYNANNARGNNFLGGGVFLYGTMTMKPGSAIENCFAWAGGGVAVVNGGALTMEGGVIDGCESYQGGGVCVTNGSLTLKDGAVRNCNAATPEPLTELMDQKLQSPGEGGGVFLVWHDSLLEMTGGRIEGNSAKYGGGVGCDSGTLRASGGTVTENTAQRFGGGVLASPLLDVRISGDFLVTGNASGEPGYENLYLDGSEGTQGGAATRPFVVTGPVTADIDLGLARWVHPDETHPFRVVATPGEGYAITPEDLSHFISDAPGYVLLLKDGDIVLTTADVTFDNQGHGAPVPDQALASHRKVQTPDPLTETGYTFGGWYADPDCTAKWDFDACVTDYREDPLTLYAQWTPIAYAISYDLNGGTAAGGDPERYTIETEAVALQAPTRTGYTFRGWTEHDEDTPEVNVTIPQGSTGSKTFTAHWEPISYEIVYDFGGGSVEIENPDHYTIESLDIALHAPTRVGYTFRGWTWAEHETPEQNATIPHGSTEKKSFTAHWEPISYEIIYDLDGGENAEDNPSSYTVESDDIVLQEPARGGYTFLGWTVDDGDDPQLTVTIPKGSIENKVFTAHWRRKAKPVTSPSTDASAGGDPSAPAYRACPRDAACPIWPYADAGTHAWYHDGVHFCIENHLMVGYGDDIFAPYDTLSRAMLAQILYNKKGRPTAPEAAPFDDVPEDLWYAPAAAWAAENAVVEGYGNGKFGPTDPVTREQLATMLWRYAGRPGSGETLARFPDGGEISPWAVEALRWAVEQGIVVGKDAGVLDPAATASRAEAAAMVQRFCEVVK